MELIVNRIIIIIIIIIIIVIIIIITCVSLYSRFSTVSLIPHLTLWSVGKCVSDLKLRDLAYVRH